jgi:threonine dehydrogenase-like Zn-dependent dehydrogenase
LVGACPIVAVDVRASQRDRATRSGADVVIDSSGLSPVDAVLAATGGRGVDVAAEFVGHPDTITQAVAVLGGGGRAVIVGLGAEPMAVLPPVQFVRKQLRVLGSYGFTMRTIERVLELVDAGRLNIAGSITHTFALDEANEALATLLQKIGEPQRIVITPPRSPGHPSGVI